MIIEGIEESGSRGMVEKWNNILKKVERKMIVKERKSKRKNEEKIIIKIKIKI